MSIDLEDYFCDLPFSEWNKFDDRVILLTKQILNLFDQYNTTATFFTLGYIGEKHPELIELIVSKGHEIASHGNHHLDVRKISQEEFELDISISQKILSKLSGEKILGFRAPFFSIDKKNLWALDIVKKYYKYDSSLFPIKTPLYGIPEGRRTPYYVSDSNPLEESIQETFLEIPPATLHFPMIGNIPVAGGFWLRFFPQFLIEQGIKQLNQKGFPAMCYLHPKDIDQHMPKISTYSWHYYWGLKNTEKKLTSLLKNFEFTSVRDIFF